MAAPAPPLPPIAPPGESQPSHRRIRTVGIVVALVILTAAAIGFVLAQRAPEPAGPAPQPAPAPQPEPEPEPAFDLAVASVQVDSLDNTELFGPLPPAPPAEHTDAAVAGAAAALSRYLDAQFLDPETRFSAGPLAALLTDGAQARLTPEDERGLGVLAQPPADVAPGAASADVRVLAGPDGVTAVTVTYEASMGPLTQRGSLVFVPVGDDWRADALDVVLEGPQ